MAKFFFDIVAQEFLIPQREWLARQFERASTHLDQLEQDKLDTATALDIFSFAAYLGLTAPDNSAFPDIGVAWQDLDIMTVASVTPRYITNEGNGRFSFQAKGVYALALTGSFEHASSNSGRVTHVRIYDHTAGAGGQGMTIGTGRNSEATTIPATFLFQIVDANIGQSFGLQIGNGDAYTAVSFQTLALSIYNVGQWQEIIT